MEAMTPAAALTATIDLDAIAGNVGVVRAAAGVPVMAVVKADAYGHGAVQSARAALAGGASEIGVAHVTEALELRAAGIDGTLTAWLHTPDTDFAGAIAANIGIAISSPRQLAAVVAAARSVGQPATVSAKVDTGLGRSGVAPEEWTQTARDLAAAVAEGAITFRATMSHLAFGDEPENPFNTLQAQRLDAATAELASLGVTAEITHLANSAAALTRPDLARDMVRAGIAIYGCSPIPGRDFGLTPAMTLAAEVGLVKKISAGQGVSYSHLWTAPEDTVIAILTAGYADGIPRLLSGAFAPSIAGRQYSSVGRVCMDQVVINLGADGGDVREGDRAVLFGAPATGAQSAADWASTIGTIDYEILTAVRGRAQRAYVGTAGSNQVDNLAGGGQAQ